MKNNKELLFEEFLRKIDHRVKYNIGESAKYRPLTNIGEEFDDLPVEIYNTDDGQPVPQTQSFTNEAGDQQDAPTPGGGAVPPAPSNDLPQGVDSPPAPTQAPAPAPESGELPPAEAGDELPAEISASGKETPVQQDSTGGMGAPVDANPMGAGDPNAIGGAPQVDNIQNDIIKHNIAAMQSIQDQLEGLNMTVQGLNSKLEVLNADVEEVREPTNTEKLMNKKNVSYPYYFNLNDVWSGNWFDQKRKSENDKGIRELPDGSYIADFDHLPQQSKNDVQNSFNDFN